MHTSSQRIRSNLPPNREQNINGVEGFGIFRPTSENTRKQLGYLTNKLSGLFIGEIAQTKKRFAEIREQDDFGLTLVRYSMVTRQKGRGYMGNLDLGILVDELPDDIKLDPLRLTISGIEWFRSTKNPEEWRTLVVKFEHDENFELLSRQLDRTDETLARFNLGGATENPERSHAALLKYGEAGDGMTLSKNLSRSLAEIADEQRKKLGIFTIDIEGINIGKDYRVSDPIVAQRLMSHVRVAH